MYDIKKAQEDIYKWADKNFGPLDVREQYIGMTEEVGEVGHALLKGIQGIRGYTPEKSRTEVADGIADVFVYMMNVCTLLEIDAEEVISATVDRVTKRDWVKDPVHAGDDH